MEKVEKITRLFWYDLNQISYDYTAEVTNIFKTLGLTDRVPEKLWVKVCNTKGGSDQKHPQEKMCKKAKLLSRGPYK